MKFGAVAIDAAQGCILAHSLRLASQVLKKGKRLDAQDLAALREAGLTQVVVAQLQEDDVHEDEAARQLADSLSGIQVDTGAATTGRVNLFARSAGLVLIDADRIHRCNAVHEGITTATLLPFSPVTQGQMLATIKIIPYAVPAERLVQALAATAGMPAAIQVAPYRGLSVGLILTKLADTRASVLVKMRQAVVKRLLPLQAQLRAEEVVGHDSVAVASALAAMSRLPGIDTVLISGIAATVDRADVVPAGIEQAGGFVVHAGMPVDPGNLLVMGYVQRSESRCSVVGLPTCARSPKLNGVDFVLRRLAVGIDVTAVDIMSLGVGGLIA